MCVAYSSATDQGHMDRPESGLYPGYDRKKFLADIGGGPSGAVVGTALARRFRPPRPLGSVSHGIPPQPPRPRAAFRLRDRFAVAVSVAVKRPQEAPLKASGSRAHA